MIISQENAQKMLDCLLVLANMDYGKERFFLQDDGRWYDRNSGTYISMKTMLHRIEKDLSTVIRDFYNC